MFRLEYDARDQVGRRLLSDIGRKTTTPVAEERRSHRFLPTEGVPSLPHIGPSSQRCGLLVSSFSSLYSSQRSNSSRKIQTRSGKLEDNNNC